MKTKNENKHIALCIAMFIVGTFLMALVSPYCRSLEPVWQWWIGYAGIILIIISGIKALFRISIISGSELGWF